MFVVFVVSRNVARWLSRSPCATRPAHAIRTVQDLMILASHCLVSTRLLHASCIDSVAARRWLLKCGRYRGNVRFKPRFLLELCTTHHPLEQINFVVGDRGSVVERVYTKLKRLDVQEGKKDRLFADHIL